MPPRSPLAPAQSPTLPPIAGVRMAACEAGIRYKNRKDLLVMEFAPGTTVAGVFTTSLTASAPVLRSKRHAAGGQARALLVNSGNSNAFTGQLGEQAVNQTLARTAQLLGCEAEECYVASTGVIGEPLPYEKILDALPGCIGQLMEDAWNDAAIAIMTTDTFPKSATRTAQIDGQTVTLNGIAKGSGMIAPDMATMLAFIATDAAIPADQLQAMLSEVTATTFNAITVDSDTSTSDTVLLFATGRASGTGPSALENNKAQSPKPKAHWQDFIQALDSLCLDLALQIVRDGEGASKLLTVEVSGAESDAAAKAIAMSIANSPLIKTAVAGQDPNWGRIVMAVGKSGQRADRDRLRIWIGDQLVAENGMRHPAYEEQKVAAVMREAEITFRVDLGIGPGRFTVWTCDFTDGYIRINADYRS